MSLRFYICVSLRCVLVYMGLSTAAPLSHQSFECGDILLFLFSSLYAILFCIFGALTVTNFGAV